MDKNFVFNFRVPAPQGGQVIEFSAAEAEQFLLQKLEDAKEDRRDVLWQLAVFYNRSGQHEKALERIREFLKGVSDPEERVGCVFAQGQMMENLGDYRAAVAYYREALAMRPTRPNVWYLVHNNLGFSLNALGQFIEGEEYCRKAIEIDPERPNGHKNLGIALAKQGCYREAAQAFIAATQANASDARACGLLENLLQQHPELENEFREAAESCRKAVEVAAKIVEKARPAVVPRGMC